MKKFFSLICVALMAMGAQAQNDNNEYYKANTWEANVTYGGAYGFKHHDKVMDILVGGGYNFSNRLYLGLETGTLLSVGGSDKLEGLHYVPVMLDVAYRFKTSNPKLLPFVEVRPGYAIKVSSDAGKCMVVTDAMVGLSYQVSKVIDIRGEVGYRGLYGGEATAKGIKDYYGITGNIGISIALSKSK